MTTIIFMILGLKHKEFQIVNTFKSLCDLRQKNASTAYLSGLKAFLTIIILIYHSWVYRLQYPFKKGQELMNFQKYGTIIAVIISLIMDMFFIIGGILTTKSLAKAYDNG